MSRRKKFPPRDDFPPLHRTQAVLVQIMKERGGEIEPQVAYEEAAARLKVSAALLNKLTPVEKENDWHVRVRWARDDLVKQGIIAPVEESGRGLWRLTGKEFHNPDDWVVVEDEHLVQDI